MVTKIPYDLISAFVGVFLFAEQDRIIDFIENISHNLAIHSRLILLFASLGTTIGGLPSVLISYKVNVYWFFVPFAWMTIRFIQNSIADSRTIVNRQQRYSYFIEFAVAFVILVFVGVVVFVLAPFGNMMENQDH